MIRKTIILSGPYGGLNIGDDAIALVLVKQLEKLGLEVIIASDNVQNMQTLFPKNQIIQRLYLRGLKFETLKYLKNVDGVIIGGGEQFEEPRLPNPIWGHIATNIQLLIFSKFYNKFYGTLAVGFNTKMSKFSRWLIKSFIQKSDFIGVRDIGSLEFLSHKLNVKDVFLGSDPAFLLAKRDKQIDKVNIFNKFNIPINSKIVTIIPSNDKFHDMKYLSIINSLVQKITKENIYVVYAISDIQKGYDLDIYENKLLLENDKTIWLEPKGTNLDSLLELICASDCVISSRMHPLIFSLIQETPMICISRGSKMDNLMKMVDEEDFFSIQNIKEDRLYLSLIDRLEHSEKYTQKDAENLEELREKAKEQFIQLGAKIGI